MALMILIVGVHGVYEMLLAKTLDEIQIHICTKCDTPMKESVAANEENKNGPSYSFQNISVLELMRFKVVPTNMYKHTHTHHTVLLAQ